MSTRSPSTGSPLRRRPARVSSPLAHEMATLSASVHPSDALMPINRAAAALQDTIQSLLDAQSEGLLSGLGRGDDAASSTDSRATTPSSTSSRQHAQKARTIPVRQPQKEKLSLRGARRGLLLSMQQFASLKKEEIDILSSETERRKRALNKIQTYSSKRSGLESEINRIKSEDQNQRLTGLHTSAQEVEEEIHELETRLYELRAKHGHLISEAKQLENTISANLSSYQESLRLVEKDIERFLKHPPVEAPLQLFPAPQLERSQQKEPQPFYRLNPKRRTLPIAEETWTIESGQLSKRSESVREEYDALIQGSELWSSALKEISAFEKELRRGMQSQVSSTTGGQANGLDSMRDLIDRMDRTIASLTSKLDHAELQNWNLIVCCLGAEIEAFREGRTMLAESLGITEPSPSSDATAATDAAHDPFDDSYDDDDYDQDDRLIDQQPSALEASRNGLFHEDLYSDQDQFAPEPASTLSKLPPTDLSVANLPSKSPGSRSSSTTPRGSRFLSNPQPPPLQPQQHLISPSTSPPPLPIDLATIPPSMSASVIGPSPPPPPEKQQEPESVSEDDEPGPEFFTSST